MATTYEEKMKAIRERTATGKKAREERDLRELDEIEPTIDEGSILIRIPEAPAELPGHYIGRLPSAAEWSRYRTTMWKDSKDRGVLEAKSRAGLDLSHQCRVYPSSERYADLLAARPAVAEFIGGELVKAAQGRAEAEGKD